MAKLAVLRKKAKEMGIPASLIRGATTADELEEIIADASPKGKTSKKSAAKKSTTTKKAGSKNSKTKSASSKSAPAGKSTKGKAKRPTAAKRTKDDDDSGRNLLGKVNYNKTDGWNPREDSPPDRIVKALKRFKGDREKVFNFLKKDVWDFVGKRMKDGTKRKLRGDKWAAEEMLRYRIARTDWDFAIRTDQHDKSDNRAEYGTAGTGDGVFKKNGSKKSTKAAGASKSTSKRGGSSKSKTSTKKAQKPAGKATKGKTTKGKRGPGRPKGSKNKK